jgi:hypothetical protein
MQDLSLADLNPRTLVRKHLLEPVGLDDLDDLDDDDGNDGRDPSGRRRPGATEDGSPPPYDEDAT